MTQTIINTYRTLSIFLGNLLESIGFRSYLATGIIEQGQEGQHHQGAFGGKLGQDGLLKWRMVGK